MYRRRGCGAQRRVDEKSTNREHKYDTHLWTPAIYEGTTPCALLSRGRLVPPSHATIIPKLNVTSPDKTKHTSLNFSLRTLVYTWFNHFPHPSPGPSSCADASGRETHSDHFDLPFSVSQSLIMTFDWKLTLASFDSSRSFIGSFGPMVVFINDFYMFARGQEAPKTMWSRNHMQMR